VNGKDAVDGFYKLCGVRLWDVNSRKELQRFEDSTGDRVHWAVFSPDERRVLTGHGSPSENGASQGTVRLWDVETGKLIRSMDGHTGAISCVAFSPDGRYAASSSHDQTVRLWDVETGRELHSFVGHQGIVERVAFSPDGQRLLSSSVDQTLRLWEVKNQRSGYHVPERSAVRSQPLLGLEGSQCSPG
jgi:WD40 repeat protein